MSHLKKFLLSLLENKTKKKYKIKCLKMVKQSSAKDLITEGRSIVSLFTASTVKREMCLSHIAYNMLHGSVS